MERLVSNTSPHGRRGHVCANPHMSVQTIVTLLAHGLGLLRQFYVLSLKVTQVYEPH